MTESEPASIPGQVHTGIPEPIPESAPVPDFKERVIIKNTEWWMQVDSLILRTKPYVLYRWLVWVTFALIFVFRIFFQHKFYTIGYVSGLYIVNCVIMFLSPKLDPDLYGKDVLPTAGDGDYRPFVRKLPEFVFWRRLATCLLLAYVAGLFPFLDPPVYGPLLLVYFLLVAAFNFRSRIAHMIRNRYLPFNWGKPQRNREN
jgi:hypothetical protein